MQKIIRELEERILNNEKILDNLMTVCWQPPFGPEQLKQDTHDLKVAVRILRKYQTGGLDV